MPAKGTASVCREPAHECVHRCEVRLEFYEVRCGGAALRAGTAMYHISRQQLGHCRMHFEPAYLRLYESGELNRRVEGALEKLADCRLCPRDCGVNRLEDKFAVCKTGRYVVVSSHFAHFGEEDCLRGTRGSGT